MLIAKLSKNRVPGAGHFYGIAVVACIIIGWSRPAFSIETTVAADEDSHLQLAPIKFFYNTGGALGYSFMRNSTGQSKTTQQTLYEQVYVGVGARTFIWQPWLAQVGSNLNSSVFHNNTSSNSTPTSSAINTSFSGDVTLDLLNKSRFPFQARIYRLDNRSRKSYSGTDRVFQSTGYKLSQVYKTRNNRINAGATFSSNKSGGPNINDSYGDQFNFHAALQASRYNSFSISGSVSKQSIPAQGSSSLLDTLNGNHVYKPNYSFSVGTMANLFKIRLSDSSTRRETDSQQFSSTAALRPEGTPLTVTSSVRFLKTDYSNNGILASTLENSNFNLGANYLFSKLIRMYGSVNVFDSHGAQTVTSRAALSASRPYVFKDATMIDEYRYSGSLGGSIATSNQTTTDSANQTTSTNSLGLGLYMSHALDKTSKYYAGSLSKHLDQSVSTSVSDSSKPAPVRLNSRGALTWSRGGGNANTRLSLSANDARNLRGTHNVFQMINLQASRSETLTSRESLRGSLTVQATKAESAYYSYPATIAPSAGMHYRNTRIFKVRDLSFDSDLRITDTNIAPGSANSEKRAWENKFAYQIARLSVHLNIIMQKTGTLTSTSIFFDVNRSF